MITKFNSFLNESYTDDYQKTLNAINQLVNDGNIVLKDKTPEQVVDIIMGKNKKYPQFGFESFMIAAANNNMFISEGDKERMGEYIQKIKDLGIDVPELEKLYKRYEKFNNLWKEEDKLSDELNFYDEDDEEYDKINNRLLELEEFLETEEYDKLVNNFKKELQKISKKVVEKL